MASLTIDAVREKIKEFKPQVKSLRSLSDLRLSNPYTILENGGKTIPMDVTAIKGLCNMLDMPKRFYLKLFARNKQAWTTLTKTLAEQERRPVSLVASKRRVIAIVKNISDITKHDEVLDMAQMILRDKSYQLQSIDFNGVQLHLHILHSLKFEAGRWQGEPDMYQRGVVLQNSIVDGFEGTSLIKRLNCANLAYVEIPGTAKNIYDVEKIPDFCFGQSTNELIRLIQRRVERLKQYHASLQEVMDISHLFLRGPDNTVNQFLRQYASDLRIGEIAFKLYKLNLDELEKTPRLWRSTATTPFILFDLQNWLTYIAKHDQRLTQSEITDFRIKGGTLFFEPPDLASIAPKVDLNAKPWLLSHN